MGFFDDDNQKLGFLLLFITSVVIMTPIAGYLLLVIRYDPVFKITDISSEDIKIISVHGFTLAFFFIILFKSYFEINDLILENRSAAFVKNTKRVTAIIIIYSITAICYSFNDYLEFILIGLFFIVCLAILFLFFGSEHFFLKKVMFIALLLFSLSAFTFSNNILLTSKFGGVKKKTYVAFYFLDSTNCENEKILCKSKSEKENTNHSFIVCLKLELQNFVYVEYYNGIDIIVQVKLNKACIRDTFKVLNYNKSLARKYSKQCPNLYKLH